jgi:TolC family type I secretion outer membrane protein
MNRFVTLTLAFVLTNSLYLEAKSKQLPTPTKAPLKLNLPSDYFFNKTDNAKSLSLKEVYEQAYVSDSRMDSARSDLDASRHHYDAEYARAWGPQLSLTANLVYGDRSSSPSVSSFNTNGWTHSGGITLFQPIFNYVQILQADQAQFTSSVSEVRNAIAQQDLIVRVVKTYLDILKTDESILIKQAEIEATKTHLEIVTEQFEVGLATQVDLDEAQSKVALAEAEKLEFQSSLVGNQGILSQTWGIDASELRHLKSKVKFEAPTPNDPQKWIDQALMLNLEVQYHQGVFEISRYDLQKARAALYYPTVNVVAGCSAQSTANNPFGNSNYSSNDCSAGLNISVPLFDGGYTPARTKEMEAIRERIRNDVRTSQITAAQSARLAFAALRKGITNINLYQRSSRSMSEALQGKREQYLNGQRNSFEILSTVQTLNSIKQNLISEKYDFLYNKIVLKQAVGILSVVDLQEIDALLE